MAHTRKTADNVEQLAIRVNVGGSEVTGRTGEKWAADREYVAGSWGCLDSATTDVLTTNQSIACIETIDAALDLGEPADVMLISQVLHAEGPDENAALLKKVAPWVKPGGAVVIVENLLDPDRAGPVHATTFAVNMLTGTQRGRTYTADEVCDWLRDAAFEPGEVDEIAPRTQLILARRATSSSAASSSPTA